MSQIAGAGCYHGADGRNEHCSARIITVILAPCLQHCSRFLPHRRGYEASCGWESGHRPPDIEKFCHYHQSAAARSVVTCDDLMTRVMILLARNDGVISNYTPANVRQPCQVRPGNPGSSTLGVAWRCLMLLMRDHTWAEREESHPLCSGQTLENQPFTIRRRRGQEMRFVLRVPPSPGHSFSVSHNLEAINRRYFDK